MPKHLDIKKELKDARDDRKNKLKYKVRKSIQLDRDIHIELLELCLKEESRPIAAQLVDFLRDYVKIRETAVVVPLDDAGRIKLQRLARSMDVTPERAILHLLSNCA